MANRAYVMIHVEDPIKDTQVATVMAALAQLNAIEYVDQVLGACDIVAQIEAADLDAVLGEIGTIPHVKEVAVCRLVKSVQHPFQPVPHEVGAR